jgi:hypothetical protein
MGMRQRTTPLVLGFLSVLTLVSIAICPASAQSVYVAGAVGADMLFVSNEEAFGFIPSRGSGEAISGAARLGVLVEERWGIELEVSRAAQIRDTSTPGGPFPLASAFPVFLPEIDLHTRITTISTTASIRQQVADRTALVYLGGIVFHRVDSRFEYDARRGPPIFADLGFGESLTSIGLVLPSIRTDSVQYGVGPVVGFEAHIGYGDHLTIVPGVRMHGFPEAWLLRPAVGVGWRF